MKIPNLFSLPKVSMKMKNPTVLLDIGSYATKAIDVQSGKVLIIPSFVARHTATQEVIAVGEKAKHLWNKSPESIVITQPIQFGAVADFVTSKMLIEYIFQQFKEASGSPIVFLPQVGVILSANLTTAQKNAIQRVLKELFIQSMKVTDIGVAIGQFFHFSPEDTTGKMVIDFGHQKTEVHFLVGQKVVATKRIYMGGASFMHSIQKHIRLHYQLEVGEEVAEDVVAHIRLQSVSPEIETSSPKKKKEEPAGFVVRGRHIISGLPTSARIKNEECTQEIQVILEKMITEIVEFLEDIPTTLVSDVITQGICITGGTSQLHGLAEYCSHYFSAKVFRASEPELAPVMGAKSLDQVFWKSL